MGSIATAFDANCGVCFRVDAVLILTVNIDRVAAASVCARSVSEPKRPQVSFSGSAQDPLPVLPAVYT